MIPKFTRVTGITTRLTPAQWHGDPNMNDTPIATGPLESPSTPIRSNDLRSVKIEMIYMDPDLRTTSRR